MLPGSSPITDPQILRKHARSQGPSLRRNYPASTVLCPCPTPARAAAKTALRLRTSLDAGLPRCPEYLPDVPSPLPRRTRRVPALVASPPVQAFPILSEGRHPRPNFRGLLRVHSHYGLPGCSTAQGGLCHGASIRTVTHPNRPPATRPNQQLPAWNLPPLASRALVAH